MPFAWLCIGLAIGATLGGIFGWGLGVRYATRAFRSDRQLSAASGESAEGGG